MSVSAYLDVFGAPSAAAVAAEFSLALHVPAVRVMTGKRGETWQLTGAGHTVSVHDQIGIPLLPGEGSVFADIFCWTADPIREQHRLLDLLFEHLTKFGQWGVTADSEVDGHPQKAFWPPKARPG